MTDPAFGLLLDAYTFGHLAFGVLGGWFRWAASSVLFIAVAWEALEAVLPVVGDPSLANSCADVVAVMLGMAAARTLDTWEGTDA